MAVSLGDPTPRLMGRLSLNPLRHIDPFGSVILPIIASFGGFMFAYAKPVPFNPLNIRDRYGSAKIALAGPAVNIVLALSVAAIVRGMGLNPSDILYHLLGTIVWINLMLAFFNLMPLPPLDGHHILFAFLPAQYIRIREYLFRGGFLLLILFILVIFPLVTTYLIKPLFQIIMPS